MATTDLRYGNKSLALDHEDNFKVLISPSDSHAISDREIGDSLDHPIGSEPLEFIVKPGERVLLVIPDATRQSGCGQIVNLVVRRLIANGSAPSDINIIIATGIHRSATSSEKEYLLTPFINQRIKILSHDPNDPIRNFRIGHTSSGIPVELNWVLTEFDHIVLIGSVTFHYFAGFTGGRKLICPGLASAETIAATHKLAFDCEKKGRRNGVETARLDGNPVHEAFLEAASLVEPSFAIMSIVNDKGEITEIHCGNWIESHHQACKKYLDSYSVGISEKRDIVIASCGGHPLDINMIQAHKALEAASHACNDGGTILLIAECREGLGRADFTKWFESESSSELAERLCRNYEVNGQTAWSILEKTERFNVEIVSALDDADIKKMGMKKISDTACLTKHLDDKRPGYILPFGSKIHLTTS